MARRWLNWAEAAEHTGLSERTLQRLYDAGEFPVAKLDGRVAIDREDLDEFLESKKVRKTVPAA